jgi:tetratricopeptide (TPR) repeat protein
MGLKVKNYFFIAILIVIVSLAMGIEVRSESIDEIDKRAEEYYKNKEFNKAISEWLTILEIEPNNEEIQKKIESVYDEKHRKDLSVQVAKLQLKLAKKALDISLKETNSRYDVAWNNLVTAYRIDSNDQELQNLRDEFQEFKKILDVENRKTRLSDAMRMQYYSLLPQAREKMKLKEYEDALKIWNELLIIVPLDTVSKEGKRQAELAIQNRLKYERILALLDSGIVLFNGKKYQEAELGFKQVLTIDPENKDARSYLEKINEVLDEQKNRELVRIQAEQLYVNGIDGIKKKNFDRAKEDFENVLSLIPDYKDTAERLRSIDRLKKEYEELQRVAKLKTIDVQFEKGLIALNETKYKDAIVSFEAVLVLDPKNDLAKKYIQTAKEAQDQIEEERVTEDSPYYSIVNSLEVSGKVLYDRGEYSESRRRWEKILDLFPKNKIATEYLLKCNIKINPQAFTDFSEKYIAEGRTLLKEKNFRLALQKFEMIKSIQANYPGIDALIANAKAGITTKVAANINVPLEEIDRRTRLGIDYYRKGGEDNMKLALQQFKWVNTNDPDNTAALVYINKIESQLRVGAGEPEAAQKLNDKQKKLVNTYYYKGINYYFNNRFDEAISEWRKVLIIDPTNEKAKMNIRKCIALLKR